MIETRTEVISLTDEGIVYCVVKPGCKMTLVDGQENIEAIRRLSAGLPRPVLVDTRMIQSISRQCRAFYASDEVADVQAACALVVESPFSRFIGNFFLGMNRTVFPTRLFGDDLVAREWLQPFVSG